MLGVNYFCGFLSLTVLYFVLWILSHLLLAVTGVMCIVLEIPIGCSYLPNERA
jgi:hypothetical protein